MVFILLFFSFYFYRTININKGIIYCHNKHGYDDRYNHTEIDTFNKQHFAEILYKKSLLDLLETSTTASTIGMNKKLLLIEKYNQYYSNETSVRKLNIKAGGLLTDWENHIL
jgi:hypothetical protein